MLNNATEAEADTQSNIRVLSELKAALRTQPIKSVMTSLPKTVSCYDIFRPVIAMQFRPEIHRAEWAGAGIDIPAEYEH